MVIPFKPLLTVYRGSAVCVKALSHWQQHWKGNKHKVGVFRNTTWRRSAEVFTRHTGPRRVCVSAHRQRSKCLHSWSTFHFCSASQNRFFHVNFTFKFQIPWFRTRVCDVFVCSELWHLVFPCLLYLDKQYDSSFAVYCNSTSSLLPVHLQMDLSGNTEPVGLPGMKLWHMRVDACGK